MQLVLYLTICVKRIFLSRQVFRTLDFYRKYRTVSTLSGNVISANTYHRFERIVQNDRKTSCVRRPDSLEEIVF